MIKVLLSVATEELRADLEHMIGLHDDLSLLQNAGEPGNGDDEPDIIVLSMDSEEENVQNSSNRSAAIVSLVEKPSPAWVTEALAEGVKAILHAHPLEEELVAAIRSAAVGLVVIDPHNVTIPLLENHIDIPPSTDSSVLTLRETEVLNKMAAGLSNKEIGSALGISSHTVKFHISSIMSKLGASSRTEAVTFAIRHGIIMI